MDKSADNPNSGQNGWYPPELLRDDPSDFDEFGGGHNRLAEALAGLIKDEEGGRAVALTGSFGSGKSTVIRLFRNSLEARGVRVYSFDAWAHSGDPLRRSFIEELVRFLNPEWIDEQNWEDELGRLSRQKEETNVTTSPRLTIGGILFALSALLLPLGFALFSRHGFGNTTGCIGFALSILPFLVVAVTALVGRFSNNTTEDAFALLVREKHSEMQSTTIRTPDPTTVEFRDVFRRLAAQALADDGRTLVVVIDNLDRLPTTEAMAAWGVMRTFFDRGSSHREAWEDRFWLLVPFDAEALRQAWKENQQPIEAFDHVGGLDELMEKTFGVTLRVPPPVLSDWRDYFIDKLKQAFPYWAALSNRSIHDVYTFFLEERVRDGGPPTPRQIKMFVNRLVALDRQWKGALSIQFLALYLLVKHRINPDAKELTSEGFLNRTVAALAGANWRRQLAAAHFNVEPEKAIQVLIGTDIQLALGSGDGDGLNDRMNVAGVDSVVLDVVQELVYEGNLSKVALAARALSAAELQNSPSIDRAWELMINGIDKAPIQQASSEIGEGLVALLQKLQSEEIQVSCGQTIIARVSSLQIQDVQSEDEMEGVTANEWLATVLPVVNFFHSRRADRSLSRVLEPLTVQADPEHFVATLKGLDTLPDGLSFAPYLSPSSSPDKIVEYLASVAQNGNFTELEASVVALIPKVRSAEGKRIAWKWDSLASAIQVRLAPSVNLEAEEAHALVDTLLTLREGIKKGVVQSALSTLARNGGLYHHLYQHRADPNTTAGFIFAIALTEPNAGAPTATGNSTAGHTFYETVRDDPNEHAEITGSIVQRISDGLSLWHLITSTNTTKAKALLDHVIVGVSQLEDAFYILNGEMLLAQTDVLARALSDDFQNYVGQQINQHDLLKQLDVVGFSILPLVLHQAIEGTGSNEAITKYHNDFTDKIRGFNQDEWNKHFSENGNVVQVILDISSGNIDPQLDTVFADALLAHAKSITDDSIEISTTPHSWSQLLRLLKPEAKETFIRDLREFTLASGRTALISILPLYAEPLAREGAWHEEADRAVRGLFSDIVLEGEENELLWLSQVFEHNVDALQKAERASRVSLLDRITSRQLSETESEEIRKALNELNKQLQKRLRPAKSEPLPREKGIFERAAEALFGSKEEHDTSSIDSDDSPDNDSAAS